MSVVFPESGGEMMAKVRRREISRVAAAGTGLMEAEVVKDGELVTGRTLISNTPFSYKREITLRRKYS